FKDIFVIMLIVAVVISFSIGQIRGEMEGIIDAATIGAIVIMNAVVGFVQEYRSEKAMEAMKKMTAPEARVLRDGREQFIPAREVVPGDIVLLEAGDRVPADGRLLEVVDLKTNEAPLTGESTPIQKSVGVLDEATPVADRKNSVFMATHVTYGRGRAVVTSTGMKTEFGKVAEMVQAVEEVQTPLKQKLASFAKKLGIVIVIVCAVIFALELYEIFVMGVGGVGEAVKDITTAFERAVALAVSAVPEGLPAVVTVSLALGARELADRNAIIRKLASAETLGATTIICSDKTGTLTKGEMTVRKIYNNHRMVDVIGVGYEAKGEFLLDGNTIDPAERDHLSLLLRAGTLCTNAQYDGESVIGDTTEGALIVAAAKAGMEKEALEEEYPRVKEMPFTSERKRMTTVHKTPEEKLVAYVKGAPETILDRSTRVLKGKEAEKLTEKKKEALLEINEKMASEALRVLGVAYKELSEKDAEEIDEEAVEKDLVFLGLMGMIDPPREEAREANQKCQQAGIRTVMITGDHKLTAVAIAKEVGMLNSDQVLTGSELDDMSDEEFDEIVGDVAVYARVSPEHKLRIMRALKNRGEVVAMTGDGVNDAPALKQADIGVAMGITGTDVTKEAADMVLADDNFATIVTAVEGGRVIYDNIRKFSFFLLRSNFDELMVIGTFALLGLELPLTPGMILWINLVTDGGPALALTKDPPQEDVMDRPPRDPDEGILHGRVASILASFVTQFIGTGILFYVAYYIWGHPLGEAQAMAFVQATLREMVIVWNSRSEKRNAFKVGFTSNKFLLAAVIFSALLTVIIPYTGLFGTAPLDPVDWAIVLPLSLSGFLILPEVFYGRKIWRWQ
ncbi:HAD-IC family P-type ATPase, partial [Candidatus Bathyarchaeota archaeon]|nr:cation-translocating P-type ATPase [Candidatus Bathyarchaeota archaeon]NIR16415.1 cation-translocating P-type ATPase [Desulfobacterales bacterium]NIU81516.1 HAD-IC family P-type ATPase [Candidatus Bathyarchaeota archaeon]NIV68162.1 HAD-IC family P-type ATPase [Candidatus Bathyarchaeota archaeon]NIW16537.1 HAD-IC family P-type ATPase [Candidatus Bathyarchaeota archaeon]